MKQWLKDFVHNCVVHPAMPFLPVKVANWLHDKNANWAFGLERYDEVGLENQEPSLARFLQKQAEHQAKRKWLDEQPPVLIKVVKEGEKMEDVPVSVPAPTFSERLEAACVTMAWGGQSGIRTRLVLMYPDTNIDPANCVKEAATLIYYVLDTVAWTVPPQVIEQIEQRLFAFRSFE